MLASKRKKIFYIKKYSIWELCKTNLSKLGFAIVLSLANPLTLNMNSFIERNRRDIVSVYLKKLNI